MTTPRSDGGPVTEAGRAYMDHYWSRSEPPLTPGETAMREADRRRILAIEAEARVIPAPVAGADEAWEHSEHYDPDCEECVYLARPVILHDARERGLLDVERLNDVLVNLFPWWDEDKYPNRHADRIAADYNDRLSPSVPLPGETP